MEGIDAIPSYTWFITALGRICFFCLLLHQRLAEVKPLRIAVCTQALVFLHRWADVGLDGECDVDIPPNSTGGRLPGKQRRRRPDGRMYWPLLAVLVRAPSK